MRIIALLGLVMALSANAQRVAQYAECGCDIGPNLPQDSQQQCLNALVMLQMRARDGKVLDDPAQINEYVLAQTKLFSKISCGLPDSKNYQSCINNLICTQFQYVREGFAYAGPAKFDLKFNLSKADMTVPMKKSGEFFDKRQYQKLDSFDFGVRVNPTSKSLFQAYVLADIVKEPIRPYWNDRLKQDSSTEDKFPQGEARPSLLRDTGRQLPGRKLKGLNSTRKLNYLFTPDDRILINPTNTYPWSAAVQISFNLGGNGFSCSGALISPDAVLTAGHCVSKNNAWATGVVITPGRNNAASTTAGKTPFGTVGVSSMTTYTGWFSGGNFFYDMAVIKLNKPIGSTVGWFGMMSADTFNVNLNAIGYPGDKSPKGTQWYYYCPAVSDSNPSDQVTRNTCDIWPGQSGSGNYLKDSNSNRYIRGVTSYQTCTCLTSACTGSGCGAPYYNYLQQLTSRRFSDAKSWAGIA